MTRFESMGEGTETGAPFAAPRMGDNGSFTEIPVPDVPRRSVGAMAGDGSEITTHYQLEKQNPAIQALHDQIRNPKLFNMATLTEEHGLTRSQIFLYVSTIRHPYAVKLQLMMQQDAQERGIDTSDLLHVDTWLQRDELLEVATRRPDYRYSQPLRDHPITIDSIRLDRLSSAETSNVHIRVLAGFPDYGLIKKHREMYGELQADYGLPMPAQGYYIDGDGNTVTEMSTVSNADDLREDAAWDSLNSEQKDAMKSVILNLGSYISAKHEAGEEYVDDIYGPWQYATGKTATDTDPQAYLLDNDALFVDHLLGGDVYSGRTLYNARSLVEFAEVYNRNGEDKITPLDITERFGQLRDIAEEALGNADATPYERNEAVLFLEKYNRFMTEPAPLPVRDIAPFEDDDSNQFEYVSEEVVHDTQRNTYLRTLEGPQDAAEHSAAYSELAGQYDVKIPATEYFIDRDGTTVCETEAVVGDHPHARHLAGWETLSDEQKQEAQKTVLGLTSYLSEKFGRREPFLQDIYTAEQFKIGTTGASEDPQLYLIDIDHYSMDPEQEGEDEYETVAVEEFEGLLGFIEDFNRVDPEHVITQDEIRARAAVLEQHVRQQLDSSTLSETDRFNAESVLLRLENLPAADETL